MSPWNADDATPPHSAGAWRGVGASGVPRGVATDCETMSADAESVERTDQPLQDIPGYCSHEHWGSVASFGMETAGFRADVVAGAEPLRRTGLMDILFDPYFSGWVSASGVDLQALASQMGVADLREVTGWRLAERWPALMSLLEPHSATGTFQAVRLGIRDLYGPDIADQSGVEEADARVAEAYEDVFAWYVRAMKRAKLRSVIRPVQPEFYWSDLATPAARAEAVVMRTVLRIDPFLHFWEPVSPRRDFLADRTGIEPTDATSWRAFLEAVYRRAADLGALGIKQLQAYRRSLDFQQRTDAEVKFRGNLTADEIRAFQDWVVHQCCALAHERRWPHQVHVGTHNLPHSAPLPLGELATCYTAMPIVLLHCWPYATEAGWLAWRYPNVYLDTCWLAVLNPRYLHDALDTWLGLVPTHKVVCGHDATSIEMAAGSASVLRSTLRKVLSARVTAGAMSEADAHRTAARFLYDNAVELYRWQAPAA